MYRSSSAALQMPMGNSQPDRSWTPNSLRLVPDAARLSLGTVEIIDFDASCAAALAELIRSVGLEARVFPSSHDFLAAKRPRGVECIVADIRLPGISGLQLQAQLKRLGLATPFVLMTAHADVPMVVQALKAGAVDFLEKPYRDQDMLEAVGSALEQDRRRREAEDDAADLAARFATLSGREKQVMALVTSGKMNKQVAGELGLSEITVKIHRGSVMKKMKARTLPELVRMADAAALLGPSR